MRRLDKRFFCIAILIALSITGRAQKTADQPTRSLLVNVFDRNGKILRDLTKDSFRVRVDGKPAEVIDASYSFAPRRIVVLLDISGSMTDPRSAKEKWQIATEAVSDLLRESPAETSVALLTFSDQVHDVLDFSQSRSTISAFLKQGSQRPKIKRTTALQDAVLAGIKLLQPAHPGDSVYAITDGGDNASHVPSTEAQRILSDSAVRLFAFLFAEYNVHSEEEKLGPDKLSEMVRDSGGFVFGVRDNGITRSVAGYPSRVFGYEYNEETRSSIKLCSQALSDLVNGFYTLRIDIPPLRKDATIKLEVVDNAGRVRKDVGSTYPNLLATRR